MGDGLLVEFTSVVEAVGCALDIQRAMLARNADLPHDQTMLFRIGIHSGDIVTDAGGDIFGEGVNIAARIETSAQPGGICISARCTKMFAAALKPTTRTSATTRSRTSPVLSACSVSSMVRRRCMSV